jgi:hypothetical protein
MKPTSEVEDRITISILIPHYRLQMIHVFRSSTIRALRKSLNDSSLIFNGQLLDDDFTIEFYGVQSNDAIVAIPSKPERKETMRWMKITRDSDVFDETVRSLASRTSRPESFRLHDLRAFRLESRPRAFRKLCRDWQESGSPAKVEKIPTQMPVGSSTIPEEPLPICW